MSSPAVYRLRGHNAETAIILGSGLNSLVQNTSTEQTIRYEQFDDIPRLTVPSHVGQFVLGQVGKTRTVFAQGRVHLYEGHSARDVTAIVRILAGAGIKRLIITNAAGSLNPNFKPGSWMAIRDHINLTGTSPLIGSGGASPARTGPQFLDMSGTYSAPLHERFGDAAKKIGITLHEGAYAGVIGPQYETPAEVRMLQKLGADAVGMSTVLEAIQARALGVEVIGFSCLTNFAAGLAAITVTHQEVLDTGREAAADFARLLAEALS